MGAEAIIALILTNLPSIIKAGQAVYGFVAGVRKAATQTAQWTDQNEADYQAYILTLSKAPEQQPDAK